MSAPSYESTISRMTACIQDDMARNKVTGLSIALVDDQKVVWARGFGYADKEAEVPAEADTIYEIGSISKTFAAMAVMRLVEEGLMDLDQPLNAYLPTFSINQRFPDSRPISIRSILTHHSGIPGDLFNGAFTEGDPFDYDTWLLGYLQNEYTSAPVGSVMAYSNSAIDLLRPVIEKIGPGGFRAYVNHLFDLMGMANTSYELDERIPLERLSKAYSGGVLLPLLYCNLGTAGSIRSSVLDMARYIKTIHAGGTGPGGQVLSRASLEEMFTRQNENVPLDFDLPFGLTWFMNNPDYYGGLKVGHEGATAWFHSMISILYDHQLGVIVLSNTSSSDVDAIAAKTLEYALQEKTGITPSPDPLPPFSSPDTSWTQEQFQALAGTYVKDASGLSFGTVVVQGGTGGLLMEGEPDIWIPRQNGYFSLPGDNPAESQRMQYRFHTVAGRFVISLLAEGKEYLYAERYDQGTIFDVWEDRQGVYAATNINPGGELWPGTNTLAIEVGTDNILRLKGTLRGNIPIKPLTDTLAITGGIGRNRGESVRVVTVDSQEQIELWGFRYKRTLEALETFEGGTLYRTTGAGGSGSFNVAVLKGDWYQMGRQYGYLLKNLMNELHDKAAAFWVQAGRTYDELQTFAKEKFPQLEERYQRLIEGMAQTSGMSLEKQTVTCTVMMKVLTTILAGCSSMDVWGDYTGDGPLVVGRNWDLVWPTSDYGKFLTAIVYRPTGSNAVADINYAALLHPQNLMNEKGIFLDYQNGTQSDPRKGPDGSYDLLAFMLTANSIDDLEAAFRSASPSEAGIINTADAHAGHVFEFTIDRVRRRAGTNGLLVDPSWTGLQPIKPGEQGAFTLERYVNLMALGEQHKGGMNADVMMEILDRTIEAGGPTFEDGTLYQIVAKPAQRTLWLKARGYSGWERMDLKPLFSP